MNDSVFFKIEFLLLVLSSVALPLGIYGYLFRKKSIAPATVLVLAWSLIALSAADIYLLQRLADSARATTSLMDDRVFASEVSLALYLLPAVFAGIGVNLLSDVLTRHLAAAERRFATERRHSGLTSAPDRMGGNGAAPQMDCRGVADCEMAGRQSGALGSGLKRRPTNQEAQVDKTK